MIRINIGMVLIILVLLPSFSVLGSLNHSKLTIFVGGYDNPPKVFLDTNNQYIRIFPVLLNYIAYKETWNLVWVTCVWEECLQKLQTNQINMMIDVAYSNQRAQEFDFNTLPVISNWAQSYSGVNKNYTRIQDLQGARIAVLNGSIDTNGPNGIESLLIANNISVNYIIAQTYYDVLGLVNNGTADFGITNRLFGKYVQSQYTNIKNSFLTFDPVDLYFAFYNDSTLTNTIIPIIDNDLQSLENDPNSQYFLILNKYLGTPEAIPNWLIPVFILITALVALLLVINFIFRSQLNEKTKELEQELQETKDLVEKNERLKEVDRLKSIFLASMSHDLRTPLNSILGFTKLLLTEGELNDEQKRQLTLVESNSNYLLDLINDILDISKIESETLQPEYETFNLSVLLTEQIEFAKPLLKDKNVKIHLCVENEIIAHSDMRRLKQIVFNLLSNAIKFSDKGIITINVKKKDETNFEISIEDQGIGIKEKDLKNLFQPFYQVEMSSPSKYEGTGLGLYICKKLVTLLVGDLTIESEFGKGTKVIFYLPIKGEN